MEKTLYHLSFFSVASHASVEVSVPLNLIGQAPGVKLGGVLEQMLTELTVQCAPDRIPESIDINVSDMDIGTSLQVKDLVVPEGVTIVDAAETSVLSIVAPTVATEDKTETEEA